MPQLTHREYFDEEMRRGIHNENPAHRKVFEPLADFLQAQTTVFEIGCGTGLLLELLADRGVGCVGCDPNPWHHKYFCERNPFLADNFILLDEGQTGEVRGWYDAVVSIEVFEHLTEDQCREYLERCRGRCQWFVFSSTPHHDPELDEQWGHINLHDESYWVALFEEYGFTLHNRLPFPTAWALLFRAT